MDPDIGIVLPVLALLLMAVGVYADVTAVRSPPGRPSAHDLQDQKRPELTGKRALRSPAARCQRGRGGSVSISRMNAAVSPGCSIGRKCPLGPPASRSTPSWVTCAIRGEAVEGIPRLPAARRIRTGQLMSGSRDQACDAGASV
jgi:hypothetical protein